ncbi:TetR/AcrR family transcriptional regulator [Actinomadura sp. WMMB 499]|uniref:TetR/AcrR family transcriptional regulator n=1 Tax=Actinomadura sp. WMMB 499 TaxID=1219491 RepID=UPI0012447FBA|nr:TetR/AcrR family transcriptional regulator C-terminal domain-containing protein [Actinomadura sp. WMMB 499]QFG26169.1 TetR family transcriptional regulator [Actinomadura sp. WMMB 499]
MARPSTPLLSRERIRAAALEMIDGAGLAELTMRGLAKRLGVQAPSLYSHYPTKEQLLEDVADEVIDKVDYSGLEGDDWRAGLASWARSYRAALRAHPHIVPLIAYGPGRFEEMLRRADAVHGCLVRAGWPPRLATMIGASVKYLVVGAGIGSFSGGFSDDAAVYGDRYPHLQQAYLLPEFAQEIDEDSFELALGALLDGLTRHPAAPRTAG